MITRRSTGFAANEKGAQKMGALTVVCQKLSVYRITNLYEGFSKKKKCVFWTVRGSQTVWYVTAVH